MHVWINDVYIFVYMPVYIYSSIYYIVFDACFIVNLKLPSLIAHFPFPIDLQPRTINAGT